MDATMRLLEMLDSILEDTSTSGLNFSHATMGSDVDKNYNLLLGAGFSPESGSSYFSFPVASGLLPIAVSPMDIAACYSPCSAKPSQHVASYGEGIVLATAQSSGGYFNFYVSQQSDAEDYARAA